MLVLSRRAATTALWRSLTALPVNTVGHASQTRSFANRVHETPIVQNCGGKFMQWMGPGSRWQMYCALLFSGSMVYQADASANLLEVLVTSGAICSASATVFFGAKRVCDRVVTDISSCRRMGDPDEFMRVSVLGVGVKEVLEASPKDVKLLGHDGEDTYSFAVGGRQLELDTSTGKCLNRKALEILLQGKPLVTRKVKQGKKGSRR
ncbi:hypothetical protein BBO99_00006628 [Phytophthora kernoviae]|uniref:Uncharacterized protein n=2 Tax=Phytophthora kernoviae TaxID=325452 RepID=A0A3R7FZQ2_9STRA|nr:hypothetical protein G195_008003 [Phytophthora kernoviae 00238/432]KAG2512316.1 hypothetical protein JM16_005460 [Phytophthora kernoviae]KAG2522007.1 hypothetical protein JM18_005342 [Phytophthora kernoviae]RLN10398.1 hypothetical protein BBI17_006727 [Phytophthora kernoviae]RLN77570.1 hypothetical protein BBO99_00006628 [Phytophthora kernoviae]